MSARLLVACSKLSTDSSSAMACAASRVFRKLSLSSGLAVSAAGDAGGRVDREFELCARHWSDGTLWKQFKFSRCPEETNRWSYSEIRTRKTDLERCPPEDSWIHGHRFLLIDSSSIDWGSRSRAEQSEGILCNCFSPTNNWSGVAALATNRLEHNDVHRSLATSAALTLPCYPFWSTQVGDPTHGWVNREREHIHLHAQIEWCKSRE